MAIILKNPDQQVDFAVALLQIRDTLLQDALFAAVKLLEIAEVDADLVRYASATDLALLASKGLRGEIVFATPTVLKANPYLLGYYRLLQGFSQKEFYLASTGLTAFKAMEEKGRLSIAATERLPELCRALNSSASFLINSLSELALTRSFLDDLALLTLGPQLRGSANVKRGARGIILVFDLLKAIVDPYIVTPTPRVIELRNSARRTVLIEFAPDPDIIIRERLSDSSQSFRNVIAIEVKAGTDFSNVHNRIGEAEKSHQKARAAGFVECWTIVNVDKLDVPLAFRESPSTSRFYRLSQILTSDGAEFEDFRSRVASLTGIPLARASPRRRAPKKRT